MGIRERNRVRTQGQLAEAALQLFLAKGFDETTVDEVAERAGVSRRTFFRYFDSKEAAFFANQEERLESFRVLLEERTASESALLSVRRACLSMAQIYAAERTLTLAQHHVVQASRQLKAYDQQLDDKWEEAMFEALLDGQNNSEARLQARVQAGAILGTVRAVLRAWFVDDGRDDLQDMGHRAFGILAAGMAFTETDQ
jgi:AcrR family transcriptional regulator